jgi:hypothetical protein
MTLDVSGKTRTLAKFPRVTEDDRVDEVIKFED